MVEVEVLFVIVGNEFGNVDGEGFKDVEFGGKGCVVEVVVEGEYGGGVLFVSLVWVGGGWVEGYGC